MLKTFLRPAMIFFPFLLGICFPQAHILNGPPFFLVRRVLFIMVFLSCLQLDFSQLKPKREHWMVLLLNIAMGVVPYFLLKLLFPERPVLAEAAFFVGITPTAAAAPVVVSFLNGRIGFALTGFTITNLFIALSLLILLPMISGEISLGYILNVAETLFQVIWLPFLLAVVLRKFFPALRTLPKKCKLFTFSLWSFTLFVMAAIARTHFSEHPEEPVVQVLLIGFVSLVICVCNFLLGRIFSRKKYCRESSQILGQKNTNFTLFLALHYAGPLAAMGPIFYVLWHNSWNAWQMYSCDRRRIRRQRKICTEDR